MSAAAKQHRPRAHRYEVIDQYPAPDQGDGLFVLDLSRTGAQVCTRRLEPVGAQIDVRCTFVEDDLYTVVGIADVVRRDDYAGTMGLRFVWLSSDSKQAIEQLAARRASSSSRRKRRTLTRR
jgi:hypothetical protein